MKLYTIITAAIVAIASTSVSAEMSKAEKDWHLKNCYTALTDTIFNTDKSDKPTGKYWYWEPRQVTNKWDVVDPILGNDYYSTTYGDNAYEYDITVFRLQIEYIKPWGEKYKKIKYCGLYGRQALEVSIIKMKDKYFSSPKS